MLAAVQVLPQATDVPVELGAGPTELVDAILAVAIDSDADRVWLDPEADAWADYVISIERRGALVASARIAHELGLAIIHRLALIAELDLTAAGAVTATARVRRGRRSSDLVLTVHPHVRPRAELIVTTAAPRRARSSQGSMTYRDLEPGDRVDHYRVLERLGAGGMGQVYRVEQATLGRTYALKVLHADVIQRDANSIERFVREARAASRIRHPNIVDVFDFGYLADGRPYFVMELLAGHSLGERIDQLGALDVAEALAIARQLVVALAAAHEVGVVHADVTPGNIFVSEDGRIKLVDFGLAELHDNHKVEVAPGFIMGTPHYVSPEQLTGRRATAHSDQYALGCVLFEMLAGQPPFRHPDLPVLCRQHIFEDAPAVASPLSPLPVGIKRIVARCLSKAPTDRFAGMAELAEHLDAAAQLLDLGVT